MVIERVPASQISSSANAPGACFEQEDIFIPLRREEVVIEKEARVKEEVRVGKKTEIEHQTVSEKVRKEDVRIEREGGGNDSTKGSTSQGRQKEEEGEVCEPNRR